MTTEEARARYPALMAYIEDRNRLDGAGAWCDQLRKDKAEAEAGGLSDVARELRQAQADLGSYPYNRDMGAFLGLTIENNNEPRHGYYMACGVMASHAMGEARRTPEALFDQVAGIVAKGYMDKLEQN